MKYATFLLFIFTFSVACNVPKQAKIPTYSQLLNQEIPNQIPLNFRPDLISVDQLIHRGIFSPDLQEFYFTISNKNYTNFTVKSIQKIGIQWEKPQIAFFNTEYDEHGMSYSPDGNHLYFSSTRPTNNHNIPNTWHLWKSKKIQGKWSEPEFIDIPNLRQKLVSHPTITKNGRLYFHVSDLDYSNMNIYFADNINGAFQDASPITIPNINKTNNCTPYISPDGDYIIYAKIGKQLELMISYKDDQNTWSTPIKLSKEINQRGQGNPFVTIDGRFLFFITESEHQTNWHLKWISAGEIIKKPRKTIK